MCKNHTVRLLLLLAMLFLAVSPARLFAAAATSQPVFKYADWKEVQSFSVEANAVDHGWTKGADANSWVDGDRYLSMHETFDLIQPPPHNGPRNATSWDIQNAHATGNVLQHSNGGTKFRKSEHNHTGSFNDAVKKGGSLRIDFGTGKWQLVTPGFLQQKFRQSGHDYLFDNGKVLEDSDGAIDDDRIPSILINGSLEGAVRPGVLTGTGGSQGGTVDRGRSVREYRVVMWPNYRDVECVVEIEKYDHWLPEANTEFPKLPGNRLSVTAYLRPRGGGQNTPLRADKFKFDLSAVSHEPGVCMNYPRLSSTGEGTVPDDPNPDLRLSLNGQTGHVSDDGQEVLADPVPNERGQDSASVFVDSFDFGAYANLQVKCELEDGRELAGVLHTSDGEIVDITVPKRSDGSKIADSWRKKYNLGPNDAEDLDATPIGDTNKGDGFSNYEEYRGFIVDGGHLRSDPTVKDIFIRNELGDIAFPGISLFSNDTGLEAVQCLKPEFPKSRVMNQNRSSQSPRSTQEFQHGLLLQWQFFGAFSFATGTNDHPWRPKYVPVVRILYSDALPPPGKTSSARRKNMLAATIAHELCHVIGCEHHGETDPGVVTWIRRSRDVDGKTEWWFEERKANWNEQEGGFQPGDIPGDEIRIFTSPTVEIKADSPGEWPFPATVWVGMYGGQHSGNEDCIMRYACSNAYILPARPRVRFLSHGEKTGMGLCDSNIGTGVNDPKANPSRYGNASAGGCIHQFAVRDDAPDLKPKPQPKK